VFPQPHHILAVVCVIAFRTAGRMEAESGLRRDHGWFWALLSLLLSLLVMWRFNAEIGLVLLSQGLLLAGITAWRFVFDAR
jgi:hypothetical protein